MHGVYDPDNTFSTTYTALTKVRSLSACSENDNPWRECSTLEGFVDYHSNRQGGTDEFKQWLKRRIRSNGNAS